MKAILCLLSGVLFFSCVNNNENITIKEIYYTDIKTIINDDRKNAVDSAYPTTEIILLYNNNTGIIIRDRRSPAYIDRILGEHAYRINSGKPDMFFHLAPYTLQKIPIDSSNFILKVSAIVNSPLKYIYKCSFNTSKQKLFVRKLLVENSDTTQIMDIGEKNNIKEYQPFYSNNTFSILNYSKTKSDRDITKEPVLLKPTLSYPEEIKHQVKFMIAKVKNQDSIRSRFKKSTFALLSGIWNIIDGGTFIQNIHVTEDSALLVFSFNGRDSIHYKRSIKLSGEQKRHLKTLTTKDKISPLHKDSIPIPVNNYYAQLLTLYIKNNQQDFMGGILDPIHISRVVEYPKTIDSVQLDFRRYSSTITGDYERVFYEMSALFPELDSLNMVLYGQ